MESINKFNKWKEVHQAFELKYHQRSNFRWPGKENIWDEQWYNIFNFFGQLEKDSFNNESVLLDVGCGSKPALEWFNAGEKYNIDPLLNEYLRIKEISGYWSKFDDKFLISAPAEEIQDHLINSCDFILCWNVLDHSFDWKKILNNCWLYLKNEGLFLLGTDHGSKEHIGHPGIEDSQEFFNEVNKYFYIQKYSKAGFKRCRTSALLLQKK